MATARRKPQQDNEERLYGSAQPPLWLSAQELLSSALEEQHQVAAARQTSALED